MKIKDGCQWPYLSTDRNQFRPNTTRPLGEHLGQVLKTSDQGSWRRGDNEKKFTEVWTDGWTPDGPLLDKLYLSVKLKT